jgi:hypothetical protein
MSATLGSTFTTTVWVVVRIHCRSANIRTNTLPAISTCLANPNRIMLGIPHLANRRTSLARNPTNFSAGELQLCPATFPSHQDRGRTG